MGKKQEKGGWGGEERRQATLLCWTSSIRKKDSRYDGRGVVTRIKPCMSNPGILKSPGNIEQKMTLAFHFKNYIRPYRYKSQYLYTLPLSSPPHTRHVKPCCGT